MNLHTAFVTGATGLLGNNLVRELLGRGVAVKALVRSNAWMLDHPAEQALRFMKPVLSGLDDPIILAGVQKVRLGIPRDGRITDESLEKGSGYTDLDLAARRAVQITHQILPLPQAFPNPTLTVHLNFRYQR